MHSADDVSAGRADGTTHAQTAAECILLHSAARAPRNSKRFLSRPSTPRTNNARIAARDSAPFPRSLSRANSTPSLSVVWLGRWIELHPASWYAAREAWRWRCACWPLLKGLASCWLALMPGVRTALDAGVAPRSVLQIAIVPAIVPDSRDSVQPSPLPAVGQCDQDQRNRRTAAHVSDRKTFHTNSLVLLNTEN